MFAFPARGRLNGTFPRPRLLVIYSHFIAKLDTPFLWARDYSAHFHKVSHPFDVLSRRRPFFI